MRNSVRPLLSATKSSLVRKPIQELQRLQRCGPRAYFRLEAWKEQMEFAAQQLPLINTAGKSAEARSLQIWFMTGARHWYQTAFCAWSLALHSDFKIMPVVISDGTLGQKHCASLKRIFPDAVVYGADACRQMRESLLPVDKYPFIHKVLSKQLLFRKLTDVFGDSTQYRLFLDSDMLFYRRASHIEGYLQSATSPLVQVDCWESYGYSRQLCEKLVGGKSLPRAINIGVLGMNASLIDWDKVEYWLEQLIANEGWKYNITQCTASMILSQDCISYLPADLYQVLPESPVSTRPLRIMEHYVSDSKPYYFNKAWRGILGL